ncbi:MAG TPA: hypothetical protein VK009_13470 [Chloroflexota bacterium]|nr:hypothetical protein [Chloroflexota bacterium]
MLLFFRCHVMLPPPAELLDPIRQMKRHLDAGKIEAQVILNSHPGRAL